MASPLRLGALLTLALAAPAQAADLLVDGNLRIEKRLGESIQVEMTGTPGAQAALLLDFLGGPSTLFGQTVDLALSPFNQPVLLGPVPASGTLNAVSVLPSDPALLDQTVYALFATNDGGGWQLSDVAKVVIVERDTQLAGNPLSGFPHFEHVRAFNEGSDVNVAVDPLHHPQAVGVTADVYVVASKDAAGWDADPSLTDVSGGAETVTLGATLAANTFVVDAGSLSGDAGAERLGVGYDVVVDLDRNGVLDAADLIDGYGDEAGLYVVHDTTQPGPYAVTEAIYTGGSFLGQDLYYPSNIAALGELPLIIVSHGNGHNYQWYDHIGEHMASYGFVVMSHQNNTVPGIETASTTTLTNTDYLLGNLDTIQGGVLDGHVDTNTIMWIGHSRGGEGVARAYDRIFDGTWSPANYTIDDIKLVSSMAPTDFLGTNSANSHGVPYHLWVGSADADVSGCANNNIAQSFHLLGRAENRKQAITLQGAGHGVFHDGTGGNVASGPCLIGNTPTHTIMRGYMLPLFLHHATGNLPAEDFLWRQYESFHPIGAPIGNPCVVVNLQYRQGDEEGRLVIDDFQTNGSPDQASTGEDVIIAVDGAREGLYDDENSNFTDLDQIFNGFTECRASDSSNGMVFDFSGGSQSIEWVLNDDARNGRAWEYLTLRACQATRDALTISELGDITFTVALTDGMGLTRELDIGVFGGGIEEPYQRSNCGSGTGWGNEFETVRLPLREFEADGGGIDLNNLASVSLRFGPGLSSAVGRLGLDDLAFTLD